MFEETINVLSRIIPLVAVEDVNVAVGTVKALSDGGLNTVEIAFRGDCARIARCIETVAVRCPDVMVGAGTVINSDLARMAMEAGARFIVAPGFNPDTVTWCIEHGAPVIPGVDSPSLIETALARGLHVLKFFPAEIMGGVKYMVAMRGPFPQVRFVATGGISESNAAEYLRCSNVASICGSWIASRGAIDAQDWQGITARAKAAVALSISSN